MKIDPYLNFDGNCREAMEFYAETLGGTIEMMSTFAGSPMEADMPPEMRDQILHASILVDRQRIMASDGGQMYQKPQGLMVSLDIEGLDEAQRVWDALSEGGEISMPFEKTFWAERFGMVVDRFGIPWLINCDGPDAAPEG